MEISREKNYFEKKEEIKKTIPKQNNEFSDIGDLFEDTSFTNVFDDLISSIRDFNPLRVYNEEKYYQIELAGWLKSHFPNSFIDIEVQKGYSRPDIIVDNIAIEIKGPTSSKDLETIFGKCHRYLQDYPYLIVVLFTVQVAEDRYNDWEYGLKQHFPEVIVLRK